MSNKLLVLSPGVLHGEQMQIVQNAVRHVEGYAGKWARVDVERAQGSMTDMVREADANHVLLLGQNLSRHLPPPPDSGIDALHMYGILREKSGNGQRWISTPHPQQYCVDREDDTKRKSPVTAGNLIGHLTRHLELLQWGHAGWDDPTAPVRTRVVHDLRSARHFLRMVTESPVLCIDTETKDLRRIKNQLLTLQIGNDGHDGWVLPVGHAGSPLDPRVLKMVRRELRAYFERGTTARHVYANAVFDLHQLYDWLHLRWYNHDVWDVQYGEFGLDENRESRKVFGFVEDGDLWGLERICQEHGMYHYATSPVRKDERARLASTPFRRVAVYGALDAALPLRVMRMEIEVARRRNRGMMNQPYRRYVKNTLLVEGRKIQQIMVMERTGNLIDKEYTAGLAHPDSDFQKEVVKAEAEWKALPEVVEANSQLLSSSNSGRGSLWGESGKDRWIFDIGKQAHQQKLLVDVCGLEPMAYGKKGLPSLGKAFKHKYRFEPIVKAFGDLVEGRSMYGTFVVGYNQVMSKSPDMKDDRLRPRYDGKATTSRLKCAKPNTQNVPTRKERSKLIKRQFKAQRGRLYRKRDFSAHEVRVLGIAAHDPQLCERFWVGMQTRLKYQYQWNIEADRVEHWNAQLKGADVHNQNYGMMHGVDPISVTKVQRGSIKVPMFAATYGKSMPVLGEELKQEALDRIENDRRAVLYDKNGVAVTLDSKKRAQLRALDDRLQEVRERNWTRYAEELYDLIFVKKFQISGKWLVDTQRNGAKSTLAPNILGGLRHLPGYLHPDTSVQRACNRRGPNSAIQGPASNLGLQAAWQLRYLTWHWFESRGVHIDNVQCNAVHDSTESETAIVQIPLVNYLETHAFSTMLHKFMRDDMGEPSMVGFESDPEVGPVLSEMKGAVRWDDEVKAIRNGIEWGNANLGWNLPTERLMKAVEHNAKIIHGLRRREIAHQLRHGKRTNYAMLMTRANCLKLGLIFEVDIGEETPRVKREKARVNVTSARRVDWRSSL